MVRLCFVRSKEDFSFFFIFKLTATMRRSTRRFNVKVKPLKLEGFCKEKVEEDHGDCGGGGGRAKTIVVQMKWNEPKSVFVPFYRSSSSKHHRKSYSNGQRFLRNGEETVEWDDESTCDFSIVSKDGSFGSWVVSFTVLYGEISNGESKTKKLSSLGKASLNLAEVAAAKMESKVQRKLPIISTKADGAAAQATLLVCVSFVEVIGGNESSGLVHNSTGSDKGDAFFKIVTGLTGFKKKKKDNSQSDQVNCSSSGSDESAVFDSPEGSPGNQSMILMGDSSSRNISTRLSSSPSKDGFFSWKKRRLSFRQSRKNVEPLIENSRVNKVKDVPEVDVVDPQPGSCSCVADSITSSTILEGDATQIFSENESSNPGNWEMKELMSRDGKTKLKSDVFFASFDQRSERAAGESACTALVAVIADWLHSNQDFMPTRSEYDTLITQGSSEWRKLCDNEAYTNFFPDKHFDLETVLEAGLKPITVLPEKSFTGFFSPKKFETLQGAMSFDEIWDEITSHTEDNYQQYPGIYIVSWNDHFFVLKVEADAYYIMDSLGERLFEGCNQAYILKFNDSTSMNAKVSKDEVQSVDPAAPRLKDDSNSMLGKVTKEGAGLDSAVARDEKASQVQERECEEEMVCSGKECCKEYIKRFLAAIPLEELEEQEKKGAVSTFSLHRRLQIDFHYSSPSATSSLSSSAASSTHSLFNSD